MVNCTDDCIEPEGQLHKRREEDENDLQMPMKYRAGKILGVKYTLIY